MLQSAATDGKRKERLITIIQGARRHNGTICAMIRNDRGEHYHVKLFPNSQSSCYHELADGTLEKCTAYAFGMRCYHVNAVENVGLCFYDEGFIDEEEEEKERLSFSAVEAAAQIVAATVEREVSLETAYNELAKTKQVVHEPVGSRLEALGWMRGGRQGGVLSGNVNA